MDNKKMTKEEAKKLTFVFIFLSIFVTVLFGFGQLI